MGDERLSPQEHAVLARRAVALSRPPAEEADEAWVALFSLGGKSYALPLESLRATLPLKAVTFIPLSEPHVLGILRFQGQIISALSLAALLGNHGWRVDPTVLLVLDPGWGTPIAVDCEEVPKVVPVRRAELDRASRRGTAPLTVLTLAGGEAVELIDPRRLLERRSEERRAR